MPLLLTGALLKPQADTRDAGVGLWRRVGQPSSKALAELAGDVGTVAVVVTANRPTDLSRLLRSLDRQTRPPGAIIVVDNGGLEATTRVLAAHPRCVTVDSRMNLGAAGGFALGILAALSMGASHVWVMDDDGWPEAESVLAGLHAGLDETGWDAVSPLVIDAADPSRLAFPFKRGLSTTRDPANLPADRPVRGFAHLFNGLLIRRDALMRIGLPDLRLFLRGDEIDFHLRLKRQGLAFGTIPSVRFRHPNSQGDIVALVPGLLHVVVPEDVQKRDLFFRNRGYLTRRHGLWLMLVRDCLCYPWYFVVIRRGDWDGLRHWAGTAWRGFRERF